MCVLAVFIINTFFWCANAIIITFKNNMCSKLFLDKFIKLCAYLFFHFSCSLYVSMLEITCAKAIIPFRKLEFFLIFFNAEKEEFGIEDLVDDFATFFVAGQETTANTLAFCFMEIARNPEVLRK
jgi:hypothetical protein